MGKGGSFLGVIKKRVLFGGVISLLLIPVRWFMGVLGDHDCESTLFWLIFGARSKAMCVKRVYFRTP